MHGNKYVYNGFYYSIIKHSLLVLHISAKVLTGSQHVVVKRDRILDIWLRSNSVK